MTNTLDDTEIKQISFSKKPVAKILSLLMSYTTSIRFKFLALLPLHLHLLTVGGFWMVDSSSARSLLLLLFTSSLESAADRKQAFHHSLNCHQIALA